MAPRYIVGKLLKFTKGLWLLGEDAKPLDNGAVITAAMSDILTGHIRWWGGKPVEHCMALTGRGEFMTPRHELGISIRRHGRPTARASGRTPGNFLPMCRRCCRMANSCTFATSSKGGHSALGKLSRSYKQRRQKHPDDLPRIALGGDTYPHPVREYGRIPFPVFTLVEWVPNTGFLETLKEAGLSAAEPAPLPPVKQDLGDEIPF